MKKNRFHSLKFRRQHPINRFIVDFYCHSLSLVIELDGKIHLDPTVKQNDLLREEEITELGLTILRFTNNQLVNEIDLVMKEIWNLMLQLSNEY